MTTTISAPAFHEFDLIEPLQRALAAAQYTQATPIQAAAIGPLLAGRDLLGCAQTGTGKTAAFALPVLQRLELDRRRAVPLAPRVLVLSPTRELASQIAQSFQDYGRFLQFRMATVFGGVNQNPQVRALQRGVHICIATPGRLLDLFDQRYLRLDHVDTFILDEADRMLDMGFMPALKRIIAELPEQRHSLFFSATMPPLVKRLATTLLTDHVEVMVTPQSSTVERIDQRVMMVRQSDKNDLLCDLLGRSATGQALVFTRTKRGADRLAKHLGQNRIRCAAIHGGKTQATRDRVLKGFKGGQVDVLVATDLAARGIDVEGLSHVINFDMPVEPESYVHRIGRTGRAGADGTAFSFCGADEHDALRAIEKLIGRRIPVDLDHPFHSNEAPVAPARRGGGGGGNRSGARRPAATFHGGGRSGAAAAGRPAQKKFSRRTTGRR